MSPLALRGGGDGLAVIYVGNNESIHAFSDVLQSQEHKVEIAGLSHDKRSERASAIPITDGSPQTYIASYVLDVVGVQGAKTRPCGL